MFEEDRKRPTIIGDRPVTEYFAYLQEMENLKVDLYIMREMLCIKYQLSTTKANDVITRYRRNKNYA